MTELPSDIVHTDTTGNVLGRVAEELGRTKTFSAP
jgi:hypothetical protein